MEIYTIYVNLIPGNYVLNYLATRPKLVHYVSQALVQVRYYGDSYRLSYLTREAFYVLSI